MKLKNISRLLAGLLFLVSLTVDAQNVDSKAQVSLPSYYPGEFSETGILQKINFAEASLTINANQYQYIANVKVHSLNTEHSSLHTLKPGMGVGFNFSVINKKSLISEIWVLPAEAVILR